MFVQQAKEEEIHLSENKKKLGDRTITKLLYFKKNLLRILNQQP